MSPPPAQTERFGHPAGLWVLAGTELWERISFKGMQAMLVLYASGELLQPGRAERVIGLSAFRNAVEQLTGPLSTNAFAAQLFGIYIALVTMTPIIGGWFGDRLAGRRFAVASGALLMTAGHFALAFDASFLAGLLLLILGAGLFRGNLSAQIRALYAAGDRRQADAFQLYALAVNLGGFIAPLSTGLLAKYWGWHAGFGFAGVGMLVGLVTYLAGSRHLPPDRRSAGSGSEAPAPTDRRAVLGLLLLWPLLVCFWIAQSQVWNVYNLWARDHADLMVLGFSVPVPWLAALDSLAPILLAPLVITHWRRLAARGREPRLLAKMATGCLLFAVAELLLVGGSLAADGGKVALGWAFAFHLLSNAGWLYFVPVETTLYAAHAPDRLRGTLLGVAALSISAGSLISGRMGALYETVSPVHYWGINAALAGLGALAIALLARPLRRLLPQG